jgi:hypothetical protein
MKTENKMYEYKIPNMEQPVITLRYNLKSIGNNVQEHKTIWR